MTSTGREQLIAWLDRSKLKQNDLAALLHISHSYLSQILSGKRRPKLEILDQIQQVTGIPVGSWVDTERGRSDRQTPAGVE